MRRLPVFVADYVLMGYGTGAIMAVPGQDERDWEFAEVFGLPIVRTVAPPEGFEEAGGKAYTGDGPAINSAHHGSAPGRADHRRRRSWPMIDWLEDTGYRAGGDDLPPARLAVQPSAVLG